MTWTDAATAASTVATIIAAIFAAAEFFKKPAKAGRNAVQPSKAPIIAVAALAVFSWGAVAFDYFERHSKPFAYGTVVNRWGVAAPLTYFLEANTTVLSEYKASHKLMLVMRVPYAHIDRMTDKEIERSNLYTIAGNAVMLAQATAGRLRFLPLRETPVEFNLVLIPNGISADRVNSLADVEPVGGKLLATVATSIIGGPAEQPAAKSSE